MSSFVLDASTTLAWCFEDETTATAAATLEHLRDAEAVVPPLWLLELANGLVVAERRERITRAESTRFLELVGELPIRIDQTSTLPLASSVLVLARDYELSAYDAAYLELALRVGQPLATLDKALRSAADRAGVRSAVPTFEGEG
ncbi:MAG: type II toxin-antitoxin system VapC family toxin [Myxococcota bacterium]